MEVIITSYKYKKLQNLENKKIKSIDFEFDVVLKFYNS
jgi:hypothetical protein